MILIDGSKFSGGGQMIRYALAFSALTNKPFIVENIRANRPKPGLRPQHLKSVEAMKQLCDAQATGDFLHSKRLVFSPKRYKNTSLTLDIGTAGATTLLLQTLLPVATNHRRATFTLKGGTDVRWSPPIDFTRFVLLPLLRPVVNAEIELQRRGFYPKGGGIIRATLGKKERPIPLVLLERGSLQHITCHITASRSFLEEEICETIEKNIRVHLDDLDIPLRFRNEYSQIIDKGFSIVLYATFALHGAVPLISSSILSDEVPYPDDAAAQVCKQLRDRLKSDGAVDEFIADQLIPFLALYGGEFTTTKITNHLLSACKIAKLFTQANFTIKNNHISVSRIIAT